jgi:hypothetical protein
MLEKNDDKNYAYLAAHIKTVESAKTILYALNEQHIDAMILKGIYLATFVYSDFARQPGSDIDLLVRIEDAMNVKNILNKLGWHERNNLLPDLLDDYGKIGTNSLMFFSIDHPISIHLHWHVINGTWPLMTYVNCIDMGEIWANIKTVNLDDMPIKTLKPEHLIIYLCFHGFTHHFVKPVYATDIQMALNYFKNNIDWGYLHAQAKKWNMDWMVGYCLEYIKNPRIGRYSNSYWRCFTHEKGIIRKISFLYQTIFPRKTLIAQNLFLTKSQIKPIHYVNRIISQFLQRLD